MVKFLPNLVKDMSLQIEEAQQNSNRINTKKNKENLDTSCINVKNQR